MRYHNSVIGTPCSSTEHSVQQLLEALAGDLGIKGSGELLRDSRAESRRNKWLDALFLAMIVVSVIGLIYVLLYGGH